MVMIALGSLAPHVAPSAWVAEQATVVGEVSVGDAASIWYGATVRGDGDRIDIGARTNVQDGCVVHSDPGFPTTVGDGVSIGHRAVLHGCVVEDDVLVGMGAIVMNGARIGAGSVIAAGAVVVENTHVPPRSLVAGVPGTVRRGTRDDELHAIRDNADTYLALARRHAAGRRVAGPGEIE